MAETTDNGAAVGFSSHHTLRVGVEIGRLLRRPAIRVVLAVTALLPLGLLGTTFRGKFEVSLDAEYVGGVATASGANFLMFALYSGSQLVMPLLVAYVFGEAIAGEARWAFLPTLLTAPVGRGRLLWRKAVACGAVCLLGLLLFTVVSAGLGLACFGPGPLIPIAGPHLPLTQLGWRLAAILGYIGCYLTWIAALAMLLSVLARSNTAIAVAATTAITLLSHLFGGLAPLGVTRGFFPTRNFDAWTDLLNTPLSLIRILWGVFLSLGYAAVLALVTFGVFTARDIRSSD